MTTPGVDPGGAAAGMRIMVTRILAIYCLAALGPMAMEELDQLSGAQTWWLLLHSGGIVLATIALGVQALRGKAIRPILIGYTAIALSAMVTAFWGAPALDRGEQSWLWWLYGQSVLATGLLAGLRAATAYGLAFGGAYAGFLLTPAGGDLGPVYAVSEASFGAGAALVIAAIAIALIQSAEAADRLAKRVYEREREETLQRTLAEERARLDRLIHDDVMTALTAASHAAEPGEVAATARLARESLAAIDALASDTGANGEVPAGLFAAMLTGMAQRVTPRVVIHDALGPDALSLPLARRTAEAMLAATREALRNALRHASATRIEVRIGRRPYGPHVGIVVTVTDDGAGFEPQAVAADRLGVRVSMLERPRAAGVEVHLETAAGEGTRLTMTAASTARAMPEPAEQGRNGDRLPAEFPARQLTALLWCVVLGEGVLGVLNNWGSPHPLALGGAMAAVLACTLILVRVGETLTLPARWAGAVVMLGWLAAGLMSLVLPNAPPWPGPAVWHGFPLALVQVALVIRRRTKIALLGLAGQVAIDGWWAMSGELGLDGWVQMVFGPATYTFLAMLVTRILLRIAAREESLWAQQHAALEGQVGREVALVQRSMWIDDLKGAAIGPLTTIAALTSDVGDEVRRDALLVEAGLREALLARHLMSDELAGLIEEARRRGVAVTFVDSRQASVPASAERAVLARIRDVLRSETISRVVVRLGPDGGSQLASVLSDDVDATEIATIDRDGLTDARRVGRAPY